MTGQLTICDTTYMIRGHEDSDWRDQSKCLNLTINQVDALFFPKPGGKSKQAEKFCNGQLDGQMCPVREQCLSWAVESHAEGFYAGTTESERRFHRSLLMESKKPLTIADSLPPEPKSSRPKLRVVKPTHPERSLDLISGPTEVEEFSMLLEG